jgi:hypothetical protein
LSRQPFKQSGSYLRCPGFASKCVQPLSFPGKGTDSSQISRHYTINEGICVQFFFIQRSVQHLESFLYRPDPGFFFRFPDIFLKTLQRRFGLVFKWAFQAKVVLDRLFRDAYTPPSIFFRACGSVPSAKERMGLSGLPDGSRKLRFPGVFRLFSIERSGRGKEKSRH